MDEFLEIIGRTLVSSIVSLPGINVNLSRASLYRRENNEINILPIQFDDLNIQIIVKAQSNEPMDRASPRPTSHPPPSKRLPNAPEQFDAEARRTQPITDDRSGKIREIPDSAVEINTTTTYRFVADTILGREAFPVNGIDIYALRPSYNLSYHVREAATDVALRAEDDYLRMAKMDYFRHCESSPAFLAQSDGVEKFLAPEGKRSLYEYGDILLGTCSVGVDKELPLGTDIGMFPSDVFDAVYLVSIAKWRGRTSAYQIIRYFYVVLPAVDREE